jgi:hypothetical protein
MNATPRPRSARTLSLATCLLVMIAAGLVLAAAASAATYKIAGGYSTLSFDSVTLQHLEDNGLIFYPYGSATVSILPTTLSLRTPVKSGTWNTTTKSGVLNHAGGLMMVRPAYGSAWYALLWQNLAVTLGAHPYATVLVNGGTTHSVVDVSGTAAQKISTRKGQRYLTITGVALVLSTDGVGEITTVSPGAPVSAGMSFATVTTVVKIR